MTKPQMLTVNLPFPGFYESNYSYAVDSEESSWVEYHCDPQGETGEDYEESYPEPLRIDSDEMSGLLMNATTYSTAYRKIAEWHVDALDYKAGELFGLTRKAKRKAWRDNYTRQVTESYDRPSLGMTFESMDSPREYNFATDRVYADIPSAVMRDLFKRAKAEDFATLARVIRERFTSCDGFISHYPNRLAEWLAKPLMEWDHNELGTLFIAALRQAGADPEDFMREVEDSTLGDEGAYQAWESAVDWPKFEAERAELRADKLDEWRESDPEAAALYAGDSAASGELVALHCPLTLDMFEGLGQ